MKLKPEVKRLWLDALLSGDYKQGNGSLRHSEPNSSLSSSELDGGQSYCCLGVLCDVAAKNGIIEGEWDTTDAFVTNIDGKKVVSYSYPTHQFLPAFFENAPNPKDLDKDAYLDPEVTVGRTRRNLSVLNDEGIPDRRFKIGNRKFGFKEIADIIEAQL